MILKHPRITQQVDYGLMQLLTRLETRKVISMGIEMANNKKAEKPYNVGVIQT